jgi:Recombinase
MIGRLQIGAKLEVDAKQAQVVREIFGQYIAGNSYRAMAAALNEPGAVRDSNAEKDVKRKGPKSEWIVRHASRCTFISSAATIRFASSAAE